MFDGLYDYAKWSADDQKSALTSSWHFKPMPRNKLFGVMDFLYVISIASVLLEL